MPIPTRTPAEKQSSAKEKVYRQVAQWIIDGTMVPGEKLNEGEIAAWFSVSRTPVHEALMLLAEHHFVEVLPSRGSFVSRLSLEEADGIYEAISALNGVLTGLACGKRTEADLAGLEEINRQFSEALRGGDSEEVLRLDDAFHLRVAEIAGNPYLVKYLRQLQMHITRFEHIFIRDEADRQHSIQDHQAIIDAIAAGDKARASALAEANRLGVYREQRPILERAIRETTNRISTAVIDGKGEK